VERVACTVLRDQALQRWDTGDLEGAVHALSLAFQLFPDARFAYNIAQLERKRGHCGEARMQYERYLRLDPLGPLVNDAQAHLEELAHCTPAAREASPDDAVLLSRPWLPVPSPALLEHAPSALREQAASEGLSWQAVLPPALGAGALLSGVVGTLFYFDAQSASDDARAAAGNYTAADERRRVAGERALDRARGFGVAAAVLGASAIGAHFLLTADAEGPLAEVSDQAVSVGWRGSF
jgi:hypothetical protein